MKSWSVTIVAMCLSSGCVGSGFVRDADMLTVSDSSEVKAIPPAPTIASVQQPTVVTDADAEAEIRAYYALKKDCEDLKDASVANFSRDAYNSYVVSINKLIKEKEQLEKAVKAKKAKNARAARLVRKGLDEADRALERVRHYLDALDRAPRRHADVGHSKTRR